MHYNKLISKSNSEFKRITGVKKYTFKLMLRILSVQYAVDHELGGKPSRLLLEDKLLMALEYWREYRTYLHIGNAYGYSESQSYKIIKWTENSLLASGVFSIPGKKKLYTLDKESLVLIDVTETPIEKPKKKATELLFRKEETAYFKNSSSCR